MLYKTFQLNGEEAFYTGNGLAQYTSSFDFNAVESYDFGANRNYWVNLYMLMRDVETIITKSKESGNKSYLGVAYIMKAYIASELTNLWGDVPYFDAVKAKSDQVYRPSYDKQKDIYQKEGGILDLLKQADVLLSESASQIDGDIIYNGNTSQWQKFANSLRLRFLIRISEASGVSIDVANEIKAIAENGNIFTSNDDNAILFSQMSSPNQYFIHTVRFGDFNLYRMCNTIEEYLKKYSDSRMQKWFEPTESSIEDTVQKYIGLPSGLEKGTQESLGFGDLRTVSRLESFFREPNSVHIVLMNYSEVMFLLAEASHRGYISGTTKDFYDNGITASFDYWNVAMPDGYLESTEVKFETSKAMEMIMAQKWLAHFKVGYEGWYDYKRTGMPSLKELVDNANNGNVPSRFYYPTEEQVANSENFQTATGGTDNINKRHWWEKQ